MSFSAKTARRVYIAPAKKSIAKNRLRRPAPELLVRFCNHSVHQRLGGDHF
jgi:hypothetical protein